MADMRPLPRANGFSLVEMMVALVFTMLLMAGMASVFKASLSTFYTSGETLASARRNRMSIELLGDDLNTACMYLTDPDNGPSNITAANPPFYILPNVGITGAPSPAGPNDPVTADELYFALDQALPFQGSLTATGGLSASEMVNNGVAPTVADNTYTIECMNKAYANMIQKGQQFVFMDNGKVSVVSADPAVNGTVVTVIAGGDANSFISGGGPAGLPSTFKHAHNSGVMFLQPFQMVRYRLQYLQLDPTNPNGVPCLVRDQGAYNGGGFVVDPNQPQQVVTENVQNFKVYLSANSGQTWAGFGLAPASPVPGPGGGFATGWDQGIRAELDAQLANGVGSVPASGRPGFTSTRNNNNMGENWFRFIPTLVRVDVTTRSATQRTEYATTANTAAYRLLTQSLVFMPRHSGLTLGWN